MKLPLIILVLFPTLEGNADTGPPVPQESLEAYEIVAQTALTILPSPMRPFFERNFETLQHTLARLLPLQDGRYRKASTKTARTARASHYILLDGAAAGDDSRSRSPAGRRFPQRPKKSNALNARSGWDRRGSLPGEIVSAYEGLVTAFRRRSPQAVVDNAGRLFHFATDAALPLNVSTPIRTKTEPDARPRATTDWVGSVPSDRRRGRNRLLIALIREHHARLAFETRVYPDRYRPVSDPLQAVFDVLMDSRAVAEELLASARDAPPQTETSRSALPNAHPREDHRSMKERRLALIESRLETGALLAARLLGTAWVKAGSPELNTPAMIGAAQIETHNEGKKAAITWLGSRTSTVFHRSDCPHARRIKPQNVVRFASPRQAHDAGRTPCKTCRPTP